MGSQRYRSSQYLWSRVQKWTQCNSCLQWWSKCWKNHDRISNYWWKWRFCLRFRSRIHHSQWRKHPALLLLNGFRFCRTFVRKNTWVQTEKIIHKQLQHLDWNSQLWFNSSWWYVQSLHRKAEKPKHQTNWHRFRIESKHYWRNHKYLKSALLHQVQYVLRHAQQKHHQ